MFERIKERWNDRGVRCLKCQKRLVGKEKWVCRKCQSDMTEGTIIVGGIVGLLTGIGINKHSKNNKTKADQPIPSKENMHNENQ